MVCIIPSAERRSVSIFVPLDISSIPRAIPDLVARHLVPTVTDIILAHAVGTELYIHINQNIIHDF